MFDRVGGRLTRAAVLGAVALGLVACGELPQAPTPPTAAVTTVDYQKQAEERKRAEKEAQEREERRRAVKQLQDSYNEIKAWQQTQDKAPGDPLSLRKMRQERDEFYDLLSQFINQYGPDTPELAEGTGTVQRWNREIDQISTRYRLDQTHGG
ncbi:hypothetical protein GCM10012275_07700 [Longimycelium tulufanense]|uniref:Lipoprotein n=1 Tax=Longimycelium tulufanense TaxID=907463 RepID=A0A8J3C6B4_9PSEU|nr:hypothetical protein [Longimycelium tulufanense]GGM39262.1 hypothetical protein GCM10012275_07700 [Longimycelium tulufanense]